LIVFARKGIWISPPALGDLCKEAKMEARLEDPSGTHVPARLGGKTDNLTPPLQDDLADECLASPSKGQLEVLEALEKSQHHYTPAQKDRFKRDPEKLLKFRENVETELAKMFSSNLKGNESDKVKEDLITYMRSKIGSSRAKLDGMLPDSMPGCRRTSVSWPNRSVRHTIRY
jgi:hypothetical protein